MNSLYPSLTQEHLDQVQNALCPFKIPIKHEKKTLITKICHEFVDSKQDSLNQESSVLNCLDFHLSGEVLKIIEANTNASGYLLSNLLLEDKTQALSYEDKIISSFKTIFKKNNLNEIYIIDENPESEKMYPEFLMFKDTFGRHKINGQIIETKNLPLNKECWVYNRDTDFYLESSPDLKNLWKTGKIHLSSSPFTYKAIASKNTPILTEEQTASPSYSSLKKASLKSLSLTSENKELLWEQRKKYFFKPSESFGSKGVYSGKSISRKKFENLEGSYLAQEFHPPGKVVIAEKVWKYDIRAFFSEGSVQKIIARVYQGQLTNFSNTGGGFALIEWV